MSPVTAGPPQAPSYSCRYRMDNNVTGPGDSASECGGQQQRELWPALTAFMGRQRSGRGSGSSQRQRQQGRRQKREPYSRRPPGGRAGGRAGGRPLLAPTQTPTNTQTQTTQDGVHMHVCLFDAARVQIYTHWRTTAHVQHTHG
jgi:hypothetical protein